MNGNERIAAALNHYEADKVPYDLSGTTVTAITKNAYLRAMKLRWLCFCTGAQHSGRCFSRKFLGNVGYLAGIWKVLRIENEIVLN